MEEVSLVRFLIENHILLPVVFPTGKERVIPAKTLLDHMRFEDVDAAESNKTTATFFQSYVNELEDRKEGIFQKNVLSTLFVCLSFTQTWKN